MLISIYIQCMLNIFLNGILISRSVCFNKLFNTQKATKSSIWKFYNTYVVNVIILLLFTTNMCFTLLIHAKYIHQKIVLLPHLLNFRYFMYQWKKCQKIFNPFFKDEWNNISQFWISRNNIHSIIILLNIFYCLQFDLYGLKQVLNTYIALKKHRNFFAVYTML